MSNVITNIGHDVKVGVEDIAKGVEATVLFLPKAARVLDSAIKDQPAVKAAVLELIKQGTTVIGDTATAGAAKGMNLASDAKALADAEQFFQYFRDSFVPLIERIYDEVKADVVPTVSA